MIRRLCILLALATFTSCCVNFGEAQEIAVGEKTLPMEGESFRFDGRDAFVILPPNPSAETPSRETPWVWYAPTLRGLPGDAEVWMFKQFVDAGIAIAGIDVGESYGSPQGRAAYQQFYEFLVKEKNFRTRPVLLARSRGGLMLYSWASEHPDLVAGIAGIYPVCNIESYPGLERASGAYEMSAEDLRSQLAKHNPIEKLAGLAAADVPIFHIQGDQDRVVPLEKNSAIVAERYKELNGSMTLEVVKNQGHNMWSGWFQSQPLTDFVIQHATKASTTPTQSQGDAEDLWLTYEGSSDTSQLGAGKHIVLIAAEQEYRCEQSMPMMAKLLAERHGFRCTVLFSVNERGEVDPTLPAPWKDKSKRHRIPGLHLLADADCVVWLSRFMQLSDDQMQHFHNYFDSGKPLIALRTANHGFWGGKPYMRDGKRVSLRDFLGGTFMGHHGGWHRESTKGIPVEANRDHPILTGVENVWGTSDVYRCHNEKFPFPSDCKALLLGQPLVNLQPDAPPNEAKEPLPVAWIKTWQGEKGRSSRIFHFTMGSAEDFENAGVRRMTLNSILWGLGLEASISPDLSVDIVGEYRPLKPGFNYEKLGVKPRAVEYYK